jgi:hypothetical protein
MSKQHLANMLKSMANNDMDGAKDHFSKYSAEKSTEIINRLANPEPPTEPAVTAEPVVPTEPVDDNKE